MSSDHLGAWGGRGVGGRGRGGRESGGREVRMEGGGGGGGGGGGEAREVEGRGEKVVGKWREEGRELKMVEERCM